jgi:enoyl-CoA hydratase/carnithine racemase
MDVATIGLALEGDVARIRVAHPRRRNALTAAMLDELDAALARIERDGRIRAVLIEAEAAGAFSSGADIRDWSALTPTDMGRRWIRDGNRVFARLAALDAVTVAVLGENAFGGGLELALAADFRIAADNVRLGFPETGIGAIPGWLGAARLIPLAGLARARRMILLGETIDAPTALGWGIVDAVAPAGRLAAEAERIVETARARSPVATGAAKRLLAAIVPSRENEGLHELAAAACRASPDGAEGIAAFREKRSPSFPGDATTPAGADGHKKT